MILLQCPNYELEENFTFSAVGRCQVQLQMLRCDVEHGFKWHTKMISNDSASLYGLVLKKKKFFSKHIRKVRGLPPPPFSPTNVGFFFEVKFFSKLLIIHVPSAAFVLKMRKRLKLDTGIAESSVRVESGRGAAEQRRNADANHVQSDQPYLGDAYGLLVLQLGHIFQGSCRRRVKCCAT